MKHGMWTRAVVVVSLALSANAARAEESAACRDEETVAICLDRLIQEMRKPAVDRKKDAAVAGGSKVLREKTTSDASAGAAAGVKDFLPVLAGTFGIAPGRDGEGNLTLSFNRLVDLGPGYATSLVAVLREANVLEALVSAAPEENRAAAREALEREIGDLDDTEWQASWSPVSARMGRSFGYHRAQVAAIVEKLVPAKPDEALKGFLYAVSQDQECRLLEDNIGELRQKQACSDALNSVLLRVQTLASQFASQLDDRASAVGTHNLSVFGDLVNNQPQLVVKVSYRDRHGAVGPKEWGASIGYEHGFVNVNSLNRHCGKEAMTEPACVSGYLAAIGSTIDTSPRVAFRAEFSRARRFDFELPGHAIQLHLKSSHVLRTSATFSRYFQVPTGEKEDPVRFDLEAAYEDATGDPLREDRFLATATFTRRVSDAASAVLTLVYANKPEYRGEVDKGITARLGLKFDIREKDPGAK